jgi:Reverse transcriptase (RNA-dependent DNA polymerase)
MEPRLIAQLRALFDYNESHLLIQGEESAPIPNRQGLLQGSSLSSILFNHFLNDLLQTLNARMEKVTTYGIETNNLFFADDAALHALSREDLQTLLDICEYWSRRNGIRFAPAKCVIVSSRNDEPYFMNGHEIPQQDIFRYLGIFFSSDGIKWEESMQPRIINTTQMTHWLS